MYLDLCLALFLVIGFLHSLLESRVELAEIKKCVY
jgi:hypothetical protein